MNKTDFLLNWYDREEERKVSLESSLNIPIGILTIVFALLFYLVKEFDFTSASTFEEFCLILFVGISCISAFVTTYYLFKSYHNIYRGYTYNGLPYPTQLLKYEKELIEFYGEHYGRPIKGDEEFDSYLTNKLASLVDNNAYNNDTKSKYLHSSKRFIFISILTLVLAFVPFLINSFSKPTKAQPIEVTNLTQISKQINKLENLLITIQSYDRRQPKTTDTADASTTNTAGASTTATNTSSRQNN